MAARTPSIHVFLGRPLFLLSPGIHSIINFGSLSSCIVLTWPYHWSLFLSMMSIMSGFSFTPIISFIRVCSFFILSILDLLADLLSTSFKSLKIKRKKKIAVLIGSYRQFGEACFLNLQNLFFDRLDPEYEGTRPSETPVTVYPSTRRHVPEKWNPRTDYTRLPSTGLQPLLYVAHSCANLLRIKRIPDRF